MNAGRSRGIPRLLELLEEHGVVDNFRRVSGITKAQRRGPVFTDSDLYKWMEAAAFALQVQADPDLERTVDKIIEDVRLAQGDDGYLNTFFVEDKAGARFSDLGRDHELYCAGHLIQAAVAHHRLSGSTKLLDVASRFADYLLTVFGPDKRRGFCGHPELEMAMVELFRATGKRPYLDFAGYLLDHIGFKDGSEMEGHAVRAAYACCGATDYFSETGDPATWKALEARWEDMSGSNVYVTGGIGSRYVQEAFGEPYELPNLRAYAETCAAIANAMWSFRMLLSTGGARYADMLERILYNGFLAGVSLSGDRYFYVNPLESSGGEGIDERTHERKEWYSCTCCPTNVQRMLASLPGYIYGADSEGLWINLYQSSKLKTRLKSCEAEIKQETDYPWSGEIDISVKANPPSAFSLNVRIPGWVRRCEVSLDGEVLADPEPGEYMRLEREWRDSELALGFGMETRLLDCNPRVREDNGCAAITRGPLIYCIESVDNPDFNVRDLMVSPETAFVEARSPELLGGVCTLRFKAFVVEDGGPLYGNLGERGLKKREVDVIAIPYYAWANRGKSSMIVWVPLANP